MRLTVRCRRRTGPWSRLLGTRRTRSPGRSPEPLLTFALLLPCSHASTTDWLLVKCLSMYFIGWFHNSHSSGVNVRRESSLSDSPPDLYMFTLVNLKASYMGLPLRQRILPNLEESQRKTSLRKVLSKRPVNTPVSRTMYLTSFPARSPTDSSIVPSLPWSDR